MTGPSVCIVGAGALGLCTAVHLVRRGVTDVTVLDRGFPASGSSGLSVGIIETQYLDPVEIEIRVRSMRFFSQLEADHGLEVVRNGYARLGHSDVEIEDFLASVEVQRSLGVADACVLTGGEFQAILPEMRADDITGVLWGPSDGFIDGHRYCGLLADLVRSGGGRVLTGREVLAVTQSGGAHVVQADGMAITCDYVVNAAGGWAGRIGDLLGCPVPILPQRHQACVIELDRPLPGIVPSVMDYVPHSGGYGLYFRHERPGQLIAGLHSEERLADLADPDRYARQADPDWMAGVAQRLAARLPGHDDSRISRGWAGIYPISPDGRPQVGPHPQRDTVITCAGAGGSGLQSSPALGELAADWICYGEPRALAAGTAAADLLPGRPSVAQRAPVDSDAGRTRSAGCSGQAPAEGGDRVLL
jgi:sarcosine oxidase, subunit beta